MVDMLLNSMTLFIQGKLFQDLGQFFIKLLIGTLVTAGICFASVKLGFGLWLAIGIASVVGGALQPYLFKDLKYK